MFHLYPLAVVSQGGYLAYSYCQDESEMGVSADVENIMDRLRKQVSHVVYFPTKADLIQAYHDSRSARSNSTLGPMFAGLVFDTSRPDTIKYTIRMPGELIPPTNELFFAPEPRLMKLSYQVDDTAKEYLASGFLSLQNAVDQAILDSKFNISSSSQKDRTRPFLNTVYQSFPTASFFIDNFHSTLINTGSIQMVVGLAGVKQKLLQWVVVEKERRSKEGMMMMGLKPSVFYAGWYITYLAIMCIPITLMSIFAYVLDFFPHTSIFLFFLLLFLYVQTLEVMALFMSLFFDKSKTAGMFGSLSVIILFLPSYAVMHSSSAGLVAFACLLSPPITFTMGFKAIADAEAQNTGVTIATMSSTTFTNFSFARALSLLVLNLLSSLLLGAYLSQVVPSEYGTSKPWNFCLNPRWYRRSRQDQYYGISDPLLDVVPEGVKDFQVDDQAVEKMPASAQEAVRIRGLTKIFDNKPCCAKGKDIIVAVQNLDLSIYLGQILVLLGHNGGGKSTTIGVLTGLLQPDAGSIHVFGKDLQANMESIRESLGVCPQQDTLFDSLTVREHLLFYGGLKGMFAASDEQEHLILGKVAEVGLEDKIDAVVRTLSGGQKRKLSLAIALLGDSKLIFLDEPSSGLDPASRRSVWTLLQKHKAGRAIVLTTHYMDEADTLGDRVAILSKGRLRCVGSSLFLKQIFGVGYHLDMVPTTKCDLERVKQLVLEYVPGASEDARSVSTLSFVLPLSSTPSFPAFFRYLEDKNRDLGVESYGISMTTLEEVFLRLAHEAESKMYENQSPETEGNSVGAEARDNQDAPGEFEREGSFGQQVRSMMYKRATVSKRSFRSMLLQFVLPLTYVVLFLASKLTGSSNRVEQPPLSFSMASSASSQHGLNKQGYSNVLLPIAATSEKLQQSMQAIMNSTSPVVRPYPIKSNSLDGLLDYLLDKNTPTCSSALFVAQNDGAAAPPEDLYATRFRLMYNNSAYHAMPALSLLLSNSIAQTLSSKNSSRYTIETSSEPFPYVPATSNSVLTTGVAAALFLGLAFAYVPVAFGVNLVKERENGSEHVQRVMGIRALPFWIANMIFDFASYMVSVLLTFILFASFGNDLILGENAHVASLIFVVSALSSISFTYLLSFGFSKALSLQSWLPVLYSIAALVLFFIAITFLQTAPTYVQMIAFGFSVFPQFAFSWSLFNLAQLDVHRNICKLDGCEAPTLLNILALTGADIDGFSYSLGPALLMMVIVGILSFTIVCRFQAGKWRQFRECNCTPPTQAALVVPPSRVPLPAVTLMTRIGNQQTENDDVRQERERVQNLLIADEPLQARNLRKVYYANIGFGSNRTRTYKVAVDRLAVSIQESECFGLLGPNGAGKTTVMNIFTSKEEPTSGTAMLNGLSTSDPSNLENMLSGVGFCPQQPDGLFDLMTGREHLIMYTTGKGLSDDLAVDRIDYFLRVLNLEEWADKLVSKYSGGTRRKLAMAIALIASPRIVLLDEPSCGLDPESRRGMWDVLSSRREGRSYILTTHSMEEAEAICTRIGIMVNSRLVCLGTSQQLKSTYGSGYRLQVNTKYVFANVKTNT